MIETSLNPDLVGRARRLIPGGVNSPVRSFGAVGGQPIHIESAGGCMLGDVHGREYIDLVGGWGAAILGHAHPVVTQAIAAAAQRGASPGLCTPSEVELADEIVSRVPSVEQVRLVNSGTEAVMSAIRLARAATGRELVVKMEGCYHGHADSMLASAGSGAATFGIDSSGFNGKQIRPQTLAVEFGSIESLERVLREHGRNVAAVIVEPVAGNMGVVPPPDDYLIELRARTHRTGALLILDEVMTGFRVASGGAQERFNVMPDLTTMGKVIGGGLPVGAFGGRAELMRLIAPSGPVYQAGTMSGNPVVTAAGLATLRLLDHAAYDRLEYLGSRLEGGLRDALSDSGIAHAIQRVGSMLSVFFGVRSVANFTDASTSSAEIFARFFHGMLARGVHLPPSRLESWFISLAYDDAAIDAVVEAAAEAAQEI